MEVGSKNRTWVVDLERGGERRDIVSGEMAGFMG